MRNELNDVIYAEPDSPRKLQYYPEFQHDAERCEDAEPTTDSPVATRRRSRSGAAPPERRRRQGDEPFATTRTAPRNLVLLGDALDPLALHGSRTCCQLRLRWPAPDLFSRRSLTGALLCDVPVPPTDDFTANASDAPL